MVTATALNRLYNIESCCAVGGFVFAKATEEIRRQKTLLTLVRTELDDVNDFLDNHRDSVEDRAPGILSEFQRIRERQGILEENQEFEHADIQRRLNQFNHRISDL